MKSWIRQCAVIGLAGSMVLGGLTGIRQALALTTEQVAERLQTVPVFAVTNSEGVPLLGTVENGEASQSVANVFVSQQDAQQFVTQVQETNTDLAGDIQVTPVSLAEIFELAIAEETQSVQFTIVPREQHVQEAVALLQQRGEEGDRFQGVPLFYAESSADEGGYLTIQQGEQQVIPMYFEQSGLQGLLSRVSEAEPDLAASMTIQVTNLETVIQLMQEEEDPELGSILLVPSQESIEYIRSLPQQ
ncbi:MAG: hypothetical protein KME20_17205 [Kaiparowitsia implicata GSE-PSE-MK54-09C]|jgi:nickel transport protein|nr:hypothetical protein [Kaiparowitsia implicata GSE-PSE-MK54-09C]